MARTKRKLWKVWIGQLYVALEARTLGNAVHLACRRFGVKKPKTDNETGGWVGVSAEVKPDVH